MFRGKEVFVRWPGNAHGPFTRRRVVVLLATVAILAAVICASASANSPMGVKQQLNAVAREFNAPAALAADRTGATGKCPLTTAQVRAALPLSSGLRMRALVEGCVFYTGTERDLAVDTQPVLLYVKESKGQINSQWGSGMSSTLCSTGASRNANGPTAYQLCGTTRKQRERWGRTGLPVQTGLGFDFETPNHKFVWILSLMYAGHLKGFRAQDPESGLLAVLKSFS